MPLSSFTTRDLELVKERVRNFPNYAVQLYSPPLHPEQIDYIVSLVEMIPSLEIDTGVYKNIEVSPYCEDDIIRNHLMEVLLNYDGIKMPPRSGNSFYYSRVRVLDLEHAKAYLDDNHLLKDSRFFMTFEELPHKVESNAMMDMIFGTPVTPNSTIARKKAVEMGRISDNEPYEPKFFFTVFLLDS